MQTIRRTLDFEVRADKAKEGRVTYVASTASVDLYNEIVVPSGARPLGRNVPLCDSHQTDSLARVIGRVENAYVEGRSYINVVQFALDCGNELAEQGYRMVKAGMLPACSIGFWPVQTLRPGDSGFEKAKRDLGIDGNQYVAAIYTEWRQAELSICCVGANSDALVALRSAAAKGANRSFSASPGSASRRALDERVARLPFPEAVTPALRRKLAAEMFPWPDLVD